MSSYRKKNPEISSAFARSQHIHNRSQMLGSPAYKYATALCSEVLGLDSTDKHTIPDRIYMAEPKSIESIERKARDNYDGDFGRIKDGARLTIFTDSPEELEKAMKALSPSGLNSHKFHKTMQKRSGYTFHEDPKNYVATTKRWGYAAMYAVLEYGNDGDRFEVQIYPRSMKDIYTRTHELYEQVRGNLEQWEKAHKGRKDGAPEPALSDYLTRGEIGILKEILQLHKDGLKEAGVSHLVKNFPSLNDLPSLVKEVDIVAYPQDVHVPAATHTLENTQYTYDA